MSVRTTPTQQQLTKQYQTLQRTGQKLEAKVNVQLNKRPTDQHLQKLSSYMANSSILLARAGISSRLGKSFGDVRDVYTACGYPKVINFSDYSARYFRQDYAKRVVNAFPEATWRIAPEIYETEDNEKTDFEKAINRLIRKQRMFHYLNTVDKVSGIGRYGVLLLGLDDNKPWDQEPTSASDIKYLQVFSQEDAPISEVVTDKNDPRYGLPLKYNISMGTSIDGTNVGNSMSVSVHWKRAIHIAEGCLTGDTWGTPRLECVYNRLQDVELITGGSAEMFWRGGFPGISFEAPSDAELADSTADLDEEIENYIHGLNRYIRLVGLQAKQLSPTIADPKTHIEVQLQAISSATGIPVRILTGSERAELASAQDDENWRSRVDERRRDFAEWGILRPTIDRLIDLGIVPPVADENSDEETHGYKVEWPDIHEMSEKESIELAKMTTEVISTYVNGGCESVISLHKFLTEILGWSEDEVESNLKDLDEQAAEEAEDAIVVEDASDSIKAEKDAQSVEPIASTDEDDTTGTPAAPGKKEKVAPKEVILKKANLQKKYERYVKNGGAGSGNFSHAGIPGHQGGSASGGGGESTSVTIKDTTHDAKLQKIFEQGTKPLSKKVTFGTSVVFRSGANIVGGVLSGVSGDNYEVTDRSGKKHTVAKSALRMMPKAKVAPEFNEAFRWVL